MPRIACLGWGSLVWDPRELKVELPWQADGPNVQVEFLRQSKGDRITLVLDEAAAPVRSLWVWMTLSDLDVAIDNLREREDIPEEYLYNVGRWSVDQDAPLLIDDLPGWAQAHGADAVIWTALGRKFRGSRRKRASAEDIIRHLDDLPRLNRDEAEQYVRRAPRQINTAHRRAIVDALGWTPEDPSAVSPARVQP